MKIIIGNNEQTIEPRRITVVIGKDVEFEISVNQFNELVINKGQFGEGETAILIKPSVSNEIRLI